MLTIYHMYPKLLNLYGDRGNVMALAGRCRWRGYECTVREVELNDSVDFEAADIVFLGGGSDREQALMALDLSRHTRSLGNAILNGTVVLAICGGYQLLGKYYCAADGSMIEGLGLLDFYTKAGNKRLIGNVAVEADLNGQKVKTVGFENHAGRTYLGEGLKPLGKVLKGYGNNGEDNSEGARFNNVFCTYLHGPLLPKNPRLADYLLLLALKKRAVLHELPELDDTLEDMAREKMLGRLI